ncbi:MAG: hypothetical protein RPR97_02265, partial [Colwellia sp.]
TTMNILFESKSAYFMPLGALSEMWGGGFHRIYGENFYLADVGIFGTLYRYGLVGLILQILGAGYIIIHFIRASAKPGSQVFQMMGLLLLLMTPLSAPVEYNSGILAIILFWLVSLNESKSFSGGDAESSNNKYP